MPGPRKAKKRNAAWSPDRPSGRGEVPSTLGEVLVGAQSYIAKMSGAYLGQAQWRAIVGRRIAARTRVGRMYKGTLTIKVASSAWCNELSFLKPNLLEKLSRAGHDVSDLRFRVDQEVARARPRSFGPRKSASQSAEARPAYAPVQLPAELEARLAKIEDPNLRAAIAEAARWSYRKA